MPKITEDLIRDYRITSGKGFRLKQIDPADTGNLHEKKEARELLERGVNWLAEEQEKLYASDNWSLLLIFQAMDAAGKDGTIKHVMSGINPQGCQVHSFKAPTSVDLDHDFLWRCSKVMPERGRIGIFNRSYYEEVLVVRVHPEFLAKQKLPPQLVGKKIWDQRFEDIRNFEKYHSRQGTIIRKFFLHVSRKEQQRRFLARLEEKDKNWKFSTSDIAERGHWDKYMDAYEDMIRNTASDHAPWYVVPADNKWFTRLVVAAAIVDAVHSLDLKFPEVDKKKRQQLEAIEATLKKEK
ncbi:MAG: polyphosphate kinase 2 family protein [Phycisphaeraceae bacterium]|nr:polyphosphate kinase 2 family protein [Phycisphaeraceae bacterium]